MDKNKTKKQSDKDTLAEVIKEMAKPRVAMSAREPSDIYGNRSSGRATDTNPLDPMKLLRKKVEEELAAPSQASTGMSLTPNLNTCLKILGLKATLVT
jgi:hypothetical protein